MARVLTEDQKKQRREYEKAYYHSNPSRKAYRKAYNQQWRKKNPEKNKLHHRTVKLKAKYGITIKEYDELYLKQLGLCALCHEPFGVDKPCVDHCHTTGAVRGLLHRKCNLLLGHVNDSIQLLKYAQWYLEQASYE